MSVLFADQFSSWTRLPQSMCAVCGLALCKVFPERHIGNTCCSSCGNSAAAPDEKRNKSLITLSELSLCLY